MGSEQVWLISFFLFLCQLTCLHAHLCTQQQTSALLQLKGTFSFNKSASSYCYASFPKMESWKKGSDCCLWDGVDCDGETGQVIGLDLSGSCLQGTIRPNSSLFLSFPHLQKLNLAGIDFSGSRISPEFTRFSELTHLSLASCGFSGKVPLEVFFLNKLVSLDLSGNYGLRLEEGGFELLVQNLSKIRYLDLMAINMSTSVVPNFMLNLTSLRTLLLGDSGLRGEFPCGIFHLPHLQDLELWHEDALTGYLPDFMNLSYPLQHLTLANTGFSGIMPDSVANLKSLNWLLLENNRFHGSIPTSLWNLTQITYLWLSGNNFNGILPSSISNLRNLWILGLYDNNFSGFLPSSISNLTNLKILYLHNNNFTGPFFSWDANLTQLEELDVSNNCLIGPLPSQGIVAPNLFGLNIGRNMINGTIPSWVFEFPALKYLDLSYNKLIGHTLEFKSASLEKVDFSNNNLRGIVPNSTFALTNLTLLILSFNNFSGPIPESNRFSEYLTVLDLQMNNFSGTIHDSFTMRNRLTTINLNGNGFEGPIPKSLVNCSRLEVLDLGRNKFLDRFPHWLGNLPNLHVLILQSNKLHGSILTSTRTKFPFPMLRVIDVSNNYLSGPLPITYFKNFKAMMNVDEVHYHLQYMSIDGSDYIRKTYYDSVNVVIKGSAMEMKKILTIFTAIDLSRNKFQGEIPEIIGGLNSIRGLNLSHNNLTGYIPKSIGNLTRLEWLDLSSNKLTGEIPQQLTNLSSLGTLNLSQNHLIGPIPRGKQFDTFANDSYIDNLALCGPPLSTTCGDPEATQPPPSTFGKEENLEHGSGFWWEVILPGYGFGLVIGLVMGYLMFSFEKPEWLVKMVEGVGNRSGKRLKSNARRHGGRRN